jgi:hypothetical protein
MGKDLTPKQVFVAMREDIRQIAREEVERLIPYLVAELAEMVKKQFARERGRGDILEAPIDKKRQSKDTNRRQNLTIGNR